MNNDELGFFNPHLPQETTADEHTKLGGPLLAEAAASHRTGRKQVWSVPLAGTIRGRSLRLPPGAAVGRNWSGRKQVGSVQLGRDHPGPGLVGFHRALLRALRSIRCPSSTYSRSSTACDGDTHSQKQATAHAEKLMSVLVVLTLYMQRRKKGDRGKRGGIGHTGAAKLLDTNRCRLQINQSLLLTPLRGNLHIYL